MLENIRYRPRQKFTSSLVKDNECIVFSPIIRIEDLAEGNIACKEIFLVVSLLLVEVLAPPQIKRA